MAATDEKTWDIMMSYHWGTGGKYVDKLEPMLINAGYKVWKDKNEATGNLDKAMSEGVYGSELMLLFISKEYEHSPNCQKEYDYASSLHKKIIPILVEDYKPADGSQLRLMMGSKVYYSLHKDFEGNVINLMRGIEKQLQKPGNIDIYFVESYHSKENTLDSPQVGTTIRLISLLDGLRV